jgi:hypothetical protein
MQRFRLMKIYLACVLLALIVAIAGMAWLGPSQTAATGSDADPRPEGANAMRPADDNRLTPLDATKLPVAERIRDAME